MRKTLILGLAVLFTVGLTTIAMADVLDWNEFNTNGSLDVDISQLGGENATFVNEVVTGAGSTVFVEQAAEDNALLANKLRVESGSLHLDQTVETAYVEFVNENALRSRNLRLDNLVNEFYDDEDKTSRVIFGQRTYVGDQRWAEDRESISEQTFNFKNVVGSGSYGDYLSQGVKVSGMGEDGDDVANNKGELDMWTSGTFNLWDLINPSNPEDGEGESDTDESILPDEWGQQGQFSKDASTGTFLLQDGAVEAFEAKVWHEGTINNLDYEGDTESVLDNTNLRDREDWGDWDWLEFDQGLFYVD